MKRILAIILIVLLVPTLAFAGLSVSVADFPIYFNGDKVDSEPLLYNDSTYLPLRKIAELTGAKIEWTGSSVNIRTVNLDRLKESCVMLYASKGDKDISQASGIITDWDEIITVKHFVDSGNEYRMVTNKGETYKCELIKTDVITDSAILKFRGSLKPSKLGDSSESQIGDSIILVGSPGQNKNTVSNGKITNTAGTFFDITAKSYAGSSGGGCFNTAGELVAILKGSDRDGVSYVVPINDVKKSLAQ